ncbi:MAG: glycosyltransferase family 4 protein [Candidatus Omnitrophica bacterium]|nr:glycosyltransferase family 4 protein [Candidatus Omnitrophota bacterium]
MEKTPKRKILRVIARLNVGGPAHHVAILSSGLDENRWETILAAGSVSPSEGDAGYLLEKYPCRFIPIPSLQRSVHLWKDPAAFLRIFRLLWKERPDILHTHTAKAGALGRSAGILYRLLTGRRLVIVHTFHGHALEGYFSRRLNRLFAGIERLLAFGTNRLITVSEAVKADLTALKIAPAWKIEVIPLGLDLDPFFKIEAQPPSSEKIRIGFVGRLVPVKEPELLLKALRKLTSFEGSSCFEAVIVGDGELRLETEQKARLLELTDRVRFTGWQKDLLPVYESLDILCLTSRNEGTPVAAIEALAASRPVVSTDVGGVREILTQTSVSGGGRIKSGFSVCAHGILVPPGDAQELARGLAYLIRHPELRLNMGQAGREFVREKYTSQRLIRDMEKFYESLVSTSAS